MKPEDRNETRSLERETSFATANQILLAPYALDGNQLETVFGQIMTHRIDYADLYFQYTRSESWSLEEGIVKSGSFNIDQGVGVRAVTGEKTAFAYSDDISLAALTSAAAGHPGDSAPGAGRAHPGRRSAPRDTICTCPTIRWRASTTAPRWSCWSASSATRAPSTRGWRR